MGKPTEEKERFPISSLSLSSKWNGSFISSSSFPSFSETWQNDNDFSRQDDVTAHHAIAMMMVSTDFKRRVNKRLRGWNGEEREEEEEGIEQQCWY